MIQLGHRWSVTVTTALSFINARHIFPFLLTFSILFFLFVPSREVFKCDTGEKTAGSIITYCWLWNCVDIRILSGQSAVSHPLSSCCLWNLFPWQDISVCSCNRIRILRCFMNSMNTWLVCRFRCTVITCLYESRIPWAACLWLASPVPDRCWWPSQALYIGPWACHSAGCSGAGSSCAIPAAWSRSLPPLQTTGLYS